MVAVTQYDVHTDTWIRTGPDARTLWREAVQAVADKAKDALPESHGRIDQAVKLVLAGDVELLEDGTAKVASQSNGTQKYYLVNGECQCKDFAKAPANFCKHRLSYGIAKRAQARMQEMMQALDGQAEQPEVSQPAATPPVVSLGLPEAPASANVHVKIGGRMVQITLRDTDEDRLMERMARMMARYPVDEAQTTQEPPEGWCPVHATQMYWNDPKPGDTRPGWWSHKTEDGSWCKGKQPRQAGRARR